MSLPSFVRDHGDLLAPAAFFVVYLLLQLWILPKLGVST